MKEIEQLIEELEIWKQKAVNVIKRKSKDCDLKYIIGGEFIEKINGEFVIGQVFEDGIWKQNRRDINKYKSDELKKILLAMKNTLEISEKIKNN